MPQNIEVKAIIDNPEQLHKIAGSITDIDVQIVQQEDIFVITQPHIRAFRALISGYCSQKGLKRRLSAEFTGVDHGSDGAITLCCPH